MPDKKQFITLDNLSTFATEIKEKYAPLGNITDTYMAWSMFGTRALADQKVASVSATTNKGIAISGTATAPTVGVKLSSKANNALSFADATGEDGGLYVSPSAVPVITVQEKATANTGYLKSYQVCVDGTPVAVDIDIPKDFLVKAATLETVETADTPYTGAAVGDKYIDFTVNVKAGTATTEHIYLPVNDLVDVYNAGNGLELNASTNTFCVKLDSTGVGGLTVGANGLKLAVATPDTYTSGTKTADGVAGALSSADKYKLDNVSAGANKVTVDANGVGTGTIDGVACTFYSLSADVEAVTAAQIQALLA